MVAVRQDWLPARDGRAQGLCRPRRGLIGVLDLGSTTMSRLLRWQGDAAAQPARNLTGQGFQSRTDPFLRGVGAKQLTATLAGPIADGSWAKKKLDTKHLPA